jgi:hypothetical protein
VILEFASQSMQLPSGSVQVRRLACIVEREQLQSQLAGMFRLNPSFGPHAEKLLHASMPETPDHLV